MKCTFAGINMSKAKSRRVIQPNVTRVTRSAIANPQDTQHIKPSASGLVNDLSLMTVSEQQTSTR